jgi:methyl-accepting chemotaxis protein
MDNTLSLTKDEVGLLREYINLTLSDFRETVDDYRENSEEYHKLGTLSKDISDLSLKFDSLF